MKNYYPLIDKKINEIRNSLEETKAFIHKMQTDIENIEAKRTIAEENERILQQGIKKGIKEGIRKTKISNAKKKNNGINYISKANIKLF